MEKKYQDLLNFIQEIPDEEKRDEATTLVLKLASDSITLKKLKKLVPDYEKQLKSERERHYLKFTPKEIEDMPKNIQPLFMYDDKLISCRITKRGYYQARLRREGYNIEVSAKDMKTLKQRFIKKLMAEEEKRRQKNDLNARLPLFKDYLDSWFEIKKHTVTESTYKAYSNVAKHDIYPVYGEHRIDLITRDMIQKHLFGIVERGNHRTAEKVKKMLSQIFDLAVDDFDIKNPVNKVVLAYHESNRGSALTKQEEKIFVDYCLTHTKYSAVHGLLVLLYTGMRIGEMKSVTYDENFIYCKTEKIRHGHDDVIRKIPISPMLKRVLPMIDMEKAIAINANTARDALKRVFPDRHIHELRYTFNTRAKECGCPGELVMLWVGHTFDSSVMTSKVDRRYTTYSDEYHLKEILKYDYEL